MEIEISGIEEKTLAPALSQSTGRGGLHFLCVGMLALTMCSGCAQSSAPIGGGSTPSADARVTQSFDADWRFALADPAEAAAPKFDDSGWRKLDVPHDWSIEGKIDQNNPSGKSEAFLPVGVGWYRKTFAVPATWSGRRVFIDFDGVFANSDVFINGFKLGHRPFGYVGFEYDLTDHLNPGHANVIAVRCDNSLQPATRWYTGNGILRHVRLMATDPVHLAQGGIYVTTPTISDGQATVHVQSSVLNQANAPRQVYMRTTVYGPDGAAVSADLTSPRLIPAGESAQFDEDIFVREPKRWNLDSPNMYSVVAQVVEGDKTIDNQSVPFGIREFHFDAATGFWLNGRNFKIFGCAIHAEGGAVGGAVPLGIWQRRLAELKGIGCNAIRTAHNPPAPEFLDLCDRMGFLVMDEMFDVWTVGKTPLQSRTVLADYHLYFNDWWDKDTTATILRDRNHPSIVLWSAGNEIHDITPNSDLGKRIFIPLRDLIHRLDPSRPVTLAVLRPNQNNVYTNGFSELMDVVGQNYRENEIIAANQQMPTRKIIGTENHLDVQTWQYLRDNPAYSGQFLWTGIDYLGETTGWPYISHESGLFDRIGYKRPHAWQRQSWWTKKPMVEMSRVLPAARAVRTTVAPGEDPGSAPMPQYLHDWTPENSAAHNEHIEVYTNCGQVELFLNGKSLGVKTRNADDSPIIYTVAYAAGELRVVASNDGKEVATDILHTAGKAAKIVLQADQTKLPADWDDVCFVNARVTDADGNTVPNAANEIHFAVRGPGFVAGVDNGDFVTHEPFVANEHQAYQGRCLAIVKANGAGTIMVAATADGLARAAVQVEGIGKPPVR